MWEISNASAAQAGAVEAQKAKLQTKIKVTNDSRANNKKTLNFLFTPLLSQNVRRASL